MKKLKFWMLTLSGLLFWIQIPAQWVDTGGPVKYGEIRGFYEHDSTLYCMTECGVFLFEELSYRWFPLTDREILKVAVGEEHIYASRLANGINRLHANNLNGPFLWNANGFNGDFLLHDSSLYIATTNLGVLKTDEESFDLEICNDGLPIDTFITGTFFPDTIISVRAISIHRVGDTLYCSTTNGIHKSPITNVDWISTGEPISNVVDIYDHNDTLYALKEKQLFQSPNKGKSWQLYFDGLNKITALEFKNNIKYISTINEGIYEKAGQEDWKQINNGLTDLQVTSLINFKGSLICGTTKDGCFKYNGNQWNSFSPHLICTAIIDMLVSGDTIIMSSYYDLYKTKNGNNFKQFQSSTDNSFFNHMAIINDTIFATLIKPHGPYSAFFSLNNGESWNSPANPIPNSENVYFKIVADDNGFYFWEDDEIWYTRDFGEKWIDFSFLKSNAYITNFFKFEDQLFASTGQKDSLYTRSINDGSEWIISNNGLESYTQVANIFACDSLLFAWKFDGLYSSNDLGLNWTFIYDDILKWAYRGSGIRSIVCHESTIIIAGNPGVYYSNDYGTSWKDLNKGLVKHTSNKLIIKNDTLYLGTTKHGLWKLALSDLELVASNQEIQLPELKIFPNPAQTSIRAMLSDDLSFDVLSIYTIEGVLIEHKKNDIEENIDVSHLPNGIYILKCVIENSIISSKLIINRL